MPAYNNQPHKRWGQHFLDDQTVIERIIAAICPGTKDALVEIGPGNGALTAALMQNAGSIDAIEIDHGLSVQLQKRFGKSLRLHTTDVLDFDFGKIHPDRKLTIIGNLPYNISTPILFHLIRHIDHIGSMYFMLQLEVALRLAASAGTKEYSALSVMLACFAETRLLFEVAPTSFTPRPRVVSAFVRIVPLACPLVTGLRQRQKLEHIIRRAFSCRRKMLAKSCRGMFNPEYLSAIGIDPSTRPDALTPLNFVDMLKCVDHGQ